jgi:hypothetical protein
MMRLLCLLIAGSVLASCTMSAQQPVPSGQAQTAYQRLIAGRVAKAPINCLPAYRSNDMVVVDDNTIAFNNGGTVYINHPPGGCPQLSSGHTALVTRQYGGPGLCQGDIAQVVDTLNRMTVGSCTLGDFTPFVRTGA